MVLGLAQVGWQPQVFLSNTLFSIFFLIFIICKGYLKTTCARRRELEKHVPIVGGRRKGLGFALAHELAAMRLVNTNYRKMRADDQELVKWESLYKNPLNQSCSFILFIAAIYKCCIVLLRKYSFEEKREKYYRLPWYHFKCYSHKLC